MNVAPRETQAVQLIRVSDSALHLKPGRVANRLRNQVALPPPRDTTGNQSLGHMTGSCLSAFGTKMGKSTLPELRDTVTPAPTGCEHFPKELLKRRPSAAPANDERPQWFVAFGDFWFCSTKQDCGAFPAFPRYKQRDAMQHGQWKDRCLADQAALEAARAAAAQYLRAQGYIREAEMVAGGEGDDFQEVRIAIAIWQIMNPASVSAPPIKRHGRRIAGEEC